MLVVVGGSGRKAGKTTVAVNLIRALPGARWLALKISGHAHGVAGWELTREESAVPDTDTGRFLAAGAAEAWWLRAARGRLAEAVPELRSLFARAANVIVESNSILDWFEPDLYVFVSGARSKPGVRTRMQRADVVVTPPDYGCAELIRKVAEGLISAREEKP